MVGAYALCGDPGRAQVLVDELAAESPTATLMNRIDLPRSRAVMELGRRNPQKAVELLEAGVSYEAAHLHNVFVRGMAYLQLREGEKAVAQFQRFLDRRVSGWDLIYPVARLGLARAKALAGDTAGARTAYQDFLSAWKDADPDLPILKEAKAEYARLQ